VEVNAGTVAGPVAAVAAVAGVLVANMGKMAAWYVQWYTLPVGRPFIFCA